MEKGMEIIPSKYRSLVIIPLKAPSLAITTENSLRGIKHIAREMAFSKVIPENHKTKLKHTNFMIRRMGSISRGVNMSWRVKPPLGKERPIISEIIYIETSLSMLILFLITSPRGLEERSIPIIKAPKRDGRPKNFDMSKYTESIDARKRRERSPLRFLNLSVAALVIIRLIMHKLRDVTKRLTIRTLMLLMLNEFIAPSDGMIVIMAKVIRSLVDKIPTSIFFESSSITRSSIRISSPKIVLVLNV